jgi:transketolase
MANHWAKTKYASPSKRLGLIPIKRLKSRKRYANCADAAGRNAKHYEAWQKTVTVYAAAYPELAASLRGAWDGTLPAGWDDGLIESVSGNGDMASRDASGKVLDLLRSRIPWLLGGSADLAGSNKTPKVANGSFQRDNYTGSGGLVWGA